MLSPTAGKAGLERFRFYYVDPIIVLFIVLSQVPGSVFCIICTEAEVVVLSLTLRPSDHKLGRI